MLEKILSKIKKGSAIIGLSLIGLTSMARGDLIAHYQFEGHADGNLSNVGVYDSTENHNDAVWQGGSYRASEGYEGQYSGGFNGTSGSFIYPYLDVSLDDTYQTMWLKPTGEDWRFASSLEEGVPVGKFSSMEGIGMDYEGLIDEVKIYDIPEPATLGLLAGGLVGLLAKRKKE